MASSSIEADVRALETLLGKRRRLGGELLSFDMFDRWGPKDEASRAQYEVDCARAREEHEATTKALHALVVRLRVEDPPAIERWCAGHVQILSELVERWKDAPSESRESTGAFVAKEEIAAWREVLRGEKPFVEENVYYVTIDRARYLELFGVDP